MFAILISLYLSLNSLRPDVWFVTITQALTWITDPKTNKQLGGYEPWNCKSKSTQTPKPCNISNKCALAFKEPTSNISDTRYMETCFDCPAVYPWLGDSHGSGIPGRDNYIDQSEGGGASAGRDQGDEEEQK